MSGARHIYLLLSTGSTKEAGNHLDLTEKLLTGA